MNKEFTEKVAITVYGTDSKGDMFVEDTTTGLLARDYIKLTLRKRMSRGSEIIVFNKTNGNQAEFMLEDQDATGLFQARLKDLTVDIWERDFGQPPAPVLDPTPRVHLTCKNCSTTESLPLETEAHSRLMIGEVLRRNCAKCGGETEWQAAAYLAELRRREEIKREEKRNFGVTGENLILTPAFLAALKSPPPPPLAVDVEPEVKWEEPVVEPPRVVRPQPEPVLVPAPAAAVPAVPAAAPATTPTGPPNWSERRASRRIQMKTRARVRRPDGHVEIVAPQNVSRGGIAFESKVEYVLDNRIRVALHYREGEQVLETNGMIVRVSPSANGRCYGVRFE